MEGDNIRDLKSKKGITLIALVVTIVVLLILSGITIGTLTSDNGIIKEAKSAKEQTERSELEEQIEMAIIKAEQKYRNPTIDQVIEEITKISSGITVDRLTGVITTPSGDIIEGKLDNYIGLQPGKKANATKKDNYTDSKGDKATIPGQFTVSETDNTISTGLVVIAPDGSEFVWVPVADINTMATNTSGTDENGRDNYQGKLYNFTGTGESTTSAEMTGNYGQETTSYREPSLVTGSDQDKSADVERITGTSYDASSRYYNTILGYTGSGYSSNSGAIDFGKDMQKDYNAMIESVKKYGGFYIGRYETSINSTTTIASKSGVMPMSAETGSGNTWYGMYKKQKDFGNNIESVSSSMIWGSQWDSMLNWALTGSDKGKVTATTNGNHSGSEVNTGTTITDKINNIYDLEGNRWEWTLEANSSTARVIHGRLLCFQ